MSWDLRYERSHRISRDALSQCSERRAKTNIKYVNANSWQSKNWIKDYEAEVGRKREEESELIAQAIWIYAKLCKFNIQFPCSILIFLLNLEPKLQRARWLWNAKRTKQNKNQSKPLLNGIKNSHKFKSCPGCCDWFSCLLEKCSVLWNRQIVLFQLLLSLFHSSPIEYFLYIYIYLCFGNWSRHWYILMLPWRCRTQAWSRTPLHELLNRAGAVKFSSNTMQSKALLALTHSKGQHQINGTSSKSTAFI